MSRTGREAVEKDWVWSDEISQIQAACIQDTARTLRRIEHHLLSLGSDGLHIVLQELRREALAAQLARRRKARLARRRRQARKEKHGTC